MARLNDGIIMLKLKMTLIFALACLWQNSPLFAKPTLDDYYEQAKASSPDLAAVRKKIDRINQEILVLLTERTAYVKRAGDMKAGKTAFADDRQRVLEIEKTISNQSVLLGMPKEISLPVFRLIMETSICYEQHYLDQLHQATPALR